MDKRHAQVESLDVVEPTLDDVFLATTGHALEGAEDAADTADVDTDGYERGAGGADPARGAADAAGRR